MPEKAKKPTSRIDPRTLELVGRFAQGGTAAENRSIANDPEGFAGVPEETREAVGYRRVPFNWPSSDLPQANFFVIREMADDSLRKAGYFREAALLKLSLSLTAPAHDDLAERLFHFVDFSPAPEPTPEQRRAVEAAAAAAGLPAISVSISPKAVEPNPLAHPKMSPEAEWDWLVSHAGAVSIYGKDAFSELSRGLSAALCRRWLLHGEIGPSAGDPKDPSFGNKAWAESKFPLLWSSLDHFEQSALVSLGLPFRESCEILLFEVADKAAKGWEPADAARFACAHLNTVGLDGSALLAQFAFDAFPSTLQALSAGNRAKPDPEDAALSWLRRANPGLPPLPPPVVSWLAFRLCLPEAAEVVEAAFLSGPASSERSPRERKALAEKLSLLSASLRLLPDPNAPAPAEPRVGPRAL